MFRVEKFIKSGSAAQFFSLGATLSIQVLQVPILLSVINPTQFAVYAIAMSIPAILMFSDLGIFSASSTELILLKAKGQEASMRLLSNSLVNLYYRIGALSLLGLAIFTFTLSLGFAEQTLLTSLIPLTVIYTLSLLFCSLQEVFLRGNDDYVFAWYAISVLRLLDFLVLITSVVWTKNLVFSTALMVATRIFSTLVFSKVTRNRCSWATFRIGKMNLTLFATFRKGAAGSFLLPLGNYLWSQGILLALTHSGNPAFIAETSLVKTVTGGVRQVTNALSNAQLPRLTKAFAETAESRKRIRRSLYKSSFITLLIVTPILLVITPIIYPSWTSGKIQLNYSFFLLMILSSILDVAANVLTTSAIAENSHLNSSLKYLFIGFGLAFVVFIYQKITLQELGLLFCIASLGNLILQAFSHRSHLKRGL